MELTNDNMRSRLQAFMLSEPATLLGIGKHIGLDEKQQRYLLSRFNRGMIRLNAATLKRLDEFLNTRGY